MIDKSDAEPLQLLFKKGMIEVRSINILNDLVNNALNMNQ